MKFNDYGIYENNLSAKLLINNMINKANRYKYNFSLNQKVEELTGIPSDRSVNDVGEEPVNYK